MKKGHTIKNFITILFILCLGLAACDNNIASPDVIGSHFDVSVGTLSVDKNPLTVGQGGTVFHWSVEGEADYVYIEPGIGTKPTSGAIHIDPDWSTTYKVTAFVGNESVASKSLYVSVETIDHVEIVTEPEAEICDDNLDNDYNGEVDCADEACADDEACAEAAKVYEFTNKPTDISDAILEQDVTITWESNYNYILVYVDGIFIDRIETGNGDYTFAPENEITNVELRAYQDNDSLGEVVYVTVQAHEDTSGVHPFSAKIKEFKRSPSGNLIKGQKYRVSWKVEDGTADMDGIHSNDDFKDFTAGDVSEHVLTVVDVYGNEDTRKLKIDPAKFSKVDNPFDDTIVSVIHTSEDYINYFVGQNAVYKSSDFFESGVEMVTDSSATGGESINAFADQDGNYFVGTDASIYFINGDGAVKIVTSGGFFRFKALAVSGNNVFAGTNKGFYQVIPSDTDADGYTTEKITLANGASTTDVYQILVKPTNTRRMFVITSSGVYFSSDKGQTFTPVLDETDAIIGGSWEHDSKAYVWSSDKIYKWNDGTFEEIRELRNTNINYVIKHNSRYYIATAAGVYSYDEDTDETPFFTGYDSNAKFLFAQFNVPSGDGGELKPIPLTATVFTTYVLTAEGDVSQLSWGGGFFIERILSPTLTGALIN